MAGGNADASQGLEQETDRPGKRQKRFVRSKNGCAVCRRRKVKCDEGRPACARCVLEHRVCQYPESLRESPGRPLHLHQHGSWSPGEGDNSTASSSRQGTIGIVLPAAGIGSLASEDRSHEIPLAGGSNEPTQYDDWLNFLFGSAAQDTSGSDLGSTISEWMSNSIYQPEMSTLAPAPNGVSHANAAAGGSSDMFSSEQKRKMADSTLQQRLRELCTSEVQLEAVSQFFNFVAQCFHLLTAEINSWRRVYAELSCQSPLIQNLVTCVGLISLSQIGPINRRPLAYALLTKSISEWQAIVLGRQVSMLSELQVLEIIAGAILIGHVEQFDTGLAVHTIACMVETRRVVDAVVMKSNRSVNTGQGSHFRFLLRVFLWWDTLSRTMGHGSGGSYPKDAFDLARYWEEEEGEDVIETSQCISGWPLDLLEAVARTQALAQSIEANIELDPASIRIEMRAIESQMRNCRPKVVPQDIKHTILIAELRYTVYEALQAASHIYFARKLSGSTKGVNKEIEKVIGFLNRRDIRHTQGSNGRSANHASTSGNAIAAGEDEEEDILPPANSPQSRPYYLTNVMKKRGIWKERAPDGALLWAYLQSAMAIEDHPTQNACRQTLARWDAFKDFGAVSLQFELLELIWERKRLDLENRSTEEEIWNSVLSERRWRQLLIF